MNSPKQAQVILGFILVFIALLGLTIGILRTWTWFSANYAQREVTYQNSRITAGKPDQYRDTSNPSQFTYIDIGGADTTINPDEKFQPLNLTEDWVFRGRPSGTVGLFGGGDLSREEMEDQCRNSCLGQASCGATVDEFDAECPCYVKCMCLASNQKYIDQLGTMASNLRIQANGLRDNADSMRDRADDCDDPWEVCWWGDWGRTADELREAADLLDSSAAKLDARAADMDRTKNQIIACCAVETYAGQTTCMDFAEGESCEDTVGDLTGSMNEELAYLYPVKVALERTIGELDDAVSTCNGKASATCGCLEWGWWWGSNTCISWGWQQQGYGSYDACYQAIRNNCCGTFCCNGDATRCCLDDDFCWGCSSWNRSCDEPTTDCDITCTDIESCTKCGLNPLSDSLQNKLDTEVISQINKYEAQKASISPCCTSYSTGKEQWECIMDGMD